MPSILDIRSSVVPIGGLRRAPRPQVEAVGARSEKRDRVMVVAGELAAAEIADHLRRTGLEVATASTGDAALVAMGARPPAVAFICGSMTGMEPCTLVAAMRADPMLASTPVVGLGVELPGALFIVKHPLERRGLASVKQLARAYCRRRNVG